MVAGKIFEHKAMNSCIRSERVTLSELAIGYFLGPLFANVTHSVFGCYLNRYYSDIIGWTDTERFGALSAILPAVAMVLVVIGNLAVGGLMNRTRTKQGRARPLLALSLPFVIIAHIALFSTPMQASPTVQILCIFLSYTFYYAIAHPLYYFGRSSLVNLSTRNNGDRSKLATALNASGVAAVGFGANILIPIFFLNLLFVPNADGSIHVEQSYQNWKMIIAVFNLMTAIGIVLQYYFTRERISEELIMQEQVRKSDKESMARQIKYCMKEPYWWMIIIYFVLFQFGGAMKNGSMSYYCSWVFDGIDSGTAQGLLGILGGIPTAVGIAVAWPIARKYGKQRSILVGLALSVIGGLVSFFDISSFAVVSTGVVLKGLGSIPAMYVGAALLADVLEYLEGKHGFRSDGFTMAVYGSIMAGMSAVASSVINAMLSVGGYNAQIAVQSGTVKFILAICYLGAELLCYALITLMISKLDVEKHLQKNSVK